MKIKLLIDNISEENKHEKYHKAINELSKALDIPVTIEHKEDNKEEFPYKAQDDLFNQIANERGLLLDELYSMVCVTLGLPLHSTHTKKSIDPNARKLIRNISWPDGGVISQKDLNSLIESIDKFLNRNTKGTAKEIVLKEANIARIIEQLKKKKTVEEIRKMPYTELVGQKKFLPLNDIFSKDFTERLGLYERVIANHITNVNEDTRNQIRDTINYGLLTNQPKSEISQNLFDRFGKLNKDWQKVIDTETVNVFNESFVQSQVKDRQPGEKVYFKRVEINDKVTCKFCKKATEKDVIALYVDEPRNDDKINDEYASIAIWDSKSNAGKSQSEWTWPMGVVHPYCYSDDTEVLTDNGWKLFKDVSPDDMIMSINPITNEIDYLHHKGLISYKYSGDMVHFTGLNYDKLVTPNHMCMYKSSGKGLSHSQAHAIDLINRDIMLPRAIGLWYGYDYDIEKQAKEIGIDPVLYIKLWGWFLSEGNVRTYSGRHEIKLSQKNPQDIIDDTGNCEFYRIAKDAIYIFDNDIVSKFSMFNGIHAEKKYIPEFLRNMSKKYQKIFINSFMLGDGSERLSKSTNKEFGESIEKTIRTSSPLMMSQLCEMIIKSGMFCSVLKNEQKGKEITHRNGKYITKTDCYVINITKSKYRHYHKSPVMSKVTGTYSKEIVLEKYSGMVYDVELVKWHYLLVKRNGKLAWSGNCRGTWERYVPGMDFDFSIKKSDDINKSKYLKRFIGPDGKYRYIYKQAKDKKKNREMLIKEAIENNPKLKRWGIDFNSVDNDGNYIIYHGTNSDRYNKIMKEGLKGINEPKYFTTSTSEKAAKEFAEGYSGDKVIKFKIPINKITDILWKGETTTAYNDTQHALKSGFIDKKYIDRSYNKDSDSMEIRKAKYLKRFKGKDGKWRYVYKTKKETNPREIQMKERINHTNKLVKYLQDNGWGKVDEIKYSSSSFGDSHYFYIKKDGYMFNVRVSDHSVGTSRLTEHIHANFKTKSVELLNRLNDELEYQKEKRSEKESEEKEREKQIKVELKKRVDDLKNRYKKGDISKTKLRKIAQENKWDFRWLMDYFSKSFDNTIMKAKYFKRWRGKDNKWHYLYKTVQSKEKKEEPKQLLAPNGKPSNLNSKQWHQVRTKEFKDWFGDWENDPENASKVVDENGEPLVVYHGTNSDFNIFDKQNLGMITAENTTNPSAIATSIIGFWFNTDIKESENSPYSKYIESFLNIKNYTEYTSLRSLMDEMKDYINDIEYDDIETIKDIVNNEWKENEIEDNDGIKLKDTEFGGVSYVVFEANQIKSAIENEGTFDPENPDIRKSKYLKRWKKNGIWRYIYTIPKNVDKYERSDIKQEREISQSNYTKETEAIFREIPVPEKTPDYVSQSGTQYWIDSDGVTRYSDHCGANIGTMNARCNWFIGEQNQYEQSRNYTGGYRCGRSEFNNFKDLAYKRDSNINVESKKKQYNENREKVLKVLQGNKIYGINKEGALKAYEAMKKHGPVFIKDNHLYGIETDGSITKLFPVRRKTK